MFFRLIFFIFCFSHLFLVGSASGQTERYSTGSVPSWVKPCGFSLEPVPTKPSQVSLQYLLIDQQRNWEEKAFYFHAAAKVLTQSGAEEISQLNIDFEPSYYQVVVHTIRVFREGEWSDRLETSKHKVLQRETDLEQNLYYGDLTLVYFLDDIREGDIVEYSYSIKGVHPLFASHYADIIYFQRNFSVEKIAYRLLGHPSLSFMTQPVNINIEPQIVDLLPSVREWSWEVVETSPYTPEDGQPVWYNPRAHIQISQFTNWGEVVEKRYPAYRLPADFSKTIPSDMQTLVNQWKETTQDLHERALLALRFVQDKIRYLGIEEGIGGWEPRPPSLIFQRRFGDCKDKAFLLHALLHLMDISSTPLLVHSNKGKRLSEVLPLPFVFNHVVLQIDINGELYWVDPTISLQGGPLQSNYFPDYSWGLLLHPNTEELTPLPKVVLSKPTEFESSILIESEDSASLKIKSVFYDSKADKMRRSLEWNGLQTISEDCLSDMQGVYGMVSLDSPMEIVDDRTNNVLTCLESYHIPTQKLSDQKVLEVFSHVLSSYLHSRVSPVRCSPYEISYPLWVKESIHIENPFLKWKSSEETYAQQHESLLYTLSTRIGEHHAHFDLELKHLQDHIPQASLQDYWSIVKDINWKGLPRMTIASSSIITKGVDWELAGSFVGIGLWILVYSFYRKRRLSLK